MLPLRNNNAMKKIFINITCFFIVYCIYLKLLRYCCGVTANLNIADIAKYRVELHYDFIQQSP